ncbi:potassium-transporting ATPase subunit F [Bacillus altitudinis]|nr:potassium-transporting ATPase subunit F [Bacillus altitudinis]
MRKHREDNYMFIPAIIGLVMIIYLLYVLIKPEKF